MTENISSGTQHIVDISFRGTVYNVACRQGDVAKLQEFLLKINDMANIILGTEGVSHAKIPDALVLLLVSFKLLDRVEELEGSLKMINDELAACGSRLYDESSLRSSLEELLSYCLERVDALVEIMKRRN